MAESTLNIKCLLKGMSSISTSSPSPQSGLAVTTTGSKDTFGAQRVERDGNRDDRVSVALQHQQRVSRVLVPENDTTVFRTGQDVLTVGCRAHTQDEIFVTNVGDFASRLFAQCLAITAAGH